VSGLEDLLSGTEIDAAAIEDMLSDLSVIDEVSKQPAGGGK